MNRQNDRRASAVVSPPDELVHRRTRRQLRELTAAQIQRLFAVLALGDKAFAGEPVRLIEDHADSFVKPQPVPEDLPIA